MIVITVIVVVFVMAVMVQQAFLPLIIPSDFTTYKYVNTQMSEWHVFPAQRVLLHEIR